MWLVVIQDARDAYQDAFAPAHNACQDARDAYQNTLAPAHNAYQDHVM